MESTTVAKKHEWIPVKNESNGLGYADSFIVNGSSLRCTNCSINAGGTDSNSQHQSNGSDINNGTGIGQLLENCFCWSEIVLIICFCLFIIITVIGNTLVILSVITTRRLRTVTNCFVTSLAVADWLVGVFVMPPAVAVFIMDSWELGWILCELWISLDVLLCTASILSLCAISIDRYLAVTQPLNYSRRRRSKRLALSMILVVWITSFLVTCPTLIGWYEPGRRDQHKVCRYNQNKGYVVYSAMGSFFVPMIVMIYVYIRIYCVVANRHEKMTDITIHKKSKTTENYVDPDCDPDTSENERITPTRSKKLEISKPTLTEIGEVHPPPTLDLQKSKNGGHYELMDLSTPTSKRSSTTTYKISSSSETGWSHHHNRLPSERCHEQLPGKNIRLQQKSVSTRITSMKRENKTTQTLSIVVASFIFCWLPFFLIYLITPFLAHDAISEGVKIFLTWLGWANSLLNPFIYAFYSVDFRQAFWRLTLRRFFARKQPYGNSAMSIRR